MEESRQTAEGQEAFDAIPEHDTDDLDRKVAEVFSGKVVRKDLTGLLRRSVSVPTFVLEYLLGMYCATDDSEVVRDGVSRIRRILAENYVNPDESEKIKSRIRENGQYTVIDRVSAYLDEERDIYVASFMNLAIDPFLMPAEYVRSYTKMLLGGIWCIARIEYRRVDESDADDIFGEDLTPRKKPAGKKRGPEDSPFKIVGLTPIQMPNLDLDAFIALRERFTDGEWRRLLLRSVGYEPGVLSEREQLHFLLRMVPLIERNFNMCELGPRGTGKSHLYAEVSPYSYLLSGGQTTTAKLFASLRSPARGAVRGMRAQPSIGLVGLWDAIAFDEVAGMHFRDENAVQIMKGYMANGSFGRGTDSFNASASMVFEGNINDTVSNVLKTVHLFDPFPPEFNNDSAFFDRIHAYLPGWEIPKMSSSLLSKHYGLITDCVSEFCHLMRAQDFTGHLDRFFRLNGEFNQRDEIGVRKTFSGLAKLLFPDGRMDREQARPILEYAIECRRRVKEQLKIMAGIEFIDVGLGYADVEDAASVRVIGVPEQASEALISASQLVPGHVYGVGRSVGGDYALYKLENKAVVGEFKFQMEGIRYATRVRDTMKAAFEFFKSSAGRLAPGMHIASKDYLLFFNDMQSKGLSEEVSLAEFIGLCSAAANRPVAPALVVPGILRLSGTLDALRDLEDIMRVSGNAGAKRILLPMSAIRDLQNVPDELLGSLSTVFYRDGDALDAARKALDL